MAKREYFLIVDVETTITDKVADFGGVVCDRNGKIYGSIAVMVGNVFHVDKLFYDSKAAGIWSEASVIKRTANYDSMIENGTRSIASVNAINRWLHNVKGKYNNPTLLAYNIAFDLGKCRNTQIELDIFDNKVCIWAMAVGNICNTRPYKQFALDNHLFNNRTDKGNMTYKTDAESVTGFLSGGLTSEPHTSIEDIIGYEIPTMVHIMKKRKWKENTKAYGWAAHQVRDHYRVK